jgi:CheY-like chemotaxis protein
MECLGSLTGGVAHDMNNVLGAILALASAHLGDPALAGPVRGALETIVQAADRGRRVVKGLLDFARLAPAEERELDLNAILQEQVRLLERTTLAKVRLVVDLCPDLRPVRGDPSAMALAILNLCVNAVDAMPGNGTLTLRTRNRDHGWVEVAVEDTGCGMAKETLERAASPFFTTKPAGRGTGLGLATVSSTMQAHHGHMAIQSQPGQGTQVRLHLPSCAPGSRAAEPAAEPRPPAPSRPLRVLLADDDELVRRSIQEILEILGHDVATVASGEEALDRFEAGWRADVAILDMNMPGLGGAGTLPRLRALAPSLPVLLTTGQADQPVRDLVQTYPKLAMLPKPFSMKELQQRLAELAAL